MSLLKIQNVSKTIRKKTVLSNINLEADSGSVIGFKGINGSGKTMLMRIISGLIRPTEGEVYIDGKLLHRDMSFPPSLGILLENPAFIDGYSGRDNLLLLAGIKGVATKKDVDSVLDYMALSDSAGKKYRKYSLGMKQRLGIAAAVMEKPDIVILDEPTNSLDTDGVQLVRELVAREKERGALVILSCHEYELLRSMSDVIYSIENGGITDRIEKGDFV